MYIYGTKDAEEQKQDSFSKALKSYADDSRINTGELAKLIGVSKLAANYYFSGKRSVNFNTLIALRLHPLRKNIFLNSQITHYMKTKNVTMFSASIFRAVHMKKDLNFTLVR